MPKRAAVICWGRHRWPQLAPGGLPALPSPGYQNGAVDIKDIRAWLDQRTEAGEFSGVALVWRD
ncbi:MAG TPA: hypothetical protein VIM30_06490, partial [Candidatus Limnocylindrales bacterium]